MKTAIRAKVNTEHSFEHCCILSERSENVDQKSAIEGSISNEMLETIKERILCQIQVRLLKFVQPRGVDEKSKPKKVSAARFECTICGRSFKRKNYLDLHTEIHLNERNHACKLCGKRFNTSKNLKSHLLTHKYQKKIYKCSACDKSFAREAYLREHLKTHANMKSYKCTFCGKGFNSSCNLSRHKKIHLFPSQEESEESDVGSNVHDESNAGINEDQSNNTSDANSSHVRGKRKQRKRKEDPIVVKEDVDEAIPPQEVNSSLVKEEIPEGEEENYENMAEETYDDTYMDDNHETIRSIDESVYKFRCDQCHRRFKTVKYWEEHLESKCNVRPAKCEICGQEMKFRDLNLHMRYKHGQKRQFPCKVCGEKFHTKSKMKKHREMHGEKPYPCETCGKAFLTKLQLEWHRDVHTGEAKHACDKCGKVFNTIINLRGHMRGHQETEDWTCNICGKHLTAKRKIWDHKRMHEKKEENEERKWQCTLCGVTFKRKDYLKTHMEGHLDERNYACKVCEKRFNTKKNVRSHMRTHETEPKFTCDLCGKSFIRKDSFRIHKMTHSSEKSHECDVCGKAFNMFSGLYHHKKIHARQAAKLDKPKEMPIEIEAPPGMQLVIVQEEQTMHTTQ